MHIVLFCVTLFWCSYLDAHSMPSGGDWGLGRVAAVFLRGTEDLLIDSCTFEKLDGSAVLLNKYNRHATIQNNNFHEIGENMIGLLGETEGVPEAYGMGWDGTNGDQPRFTRVLKNFAYRCGLFEKQSSFYFQAKSAQNTIKDNIFFHGPRAGMNFNDGFGGGSLVEGNLMFNTVMESGDHGPFNSVCITSSVSLCPVCVWCDWCRRSTTLVMIVSYCCSGIGKFT